MCSVLEVGELSRVKSVPGNGIFRKGWNFRVVDVVDVSNARNLVTTVHMAVKLPRPLLSLFAFVKFNLLEFELKDS